MGHVTRAAVQDRWAGPEPKMLRELGSELCWLTERPEAWRYIHVGCFHAGGRGRPVVESSHTFAPSGANVSFLRKMEIHANTCVCVCVLKEMPGWGKEKPPDSCSFSCSKYSCWNTLITQDHYHSLFASLAIDGNISSVFLIIHFTEDRCRKMHSAAKSFTWIFKQASSLLPVGFRLWPIHYRLIGMYNSQVSKEGRGGRSGLITGREPLLGWPHFMWDASQEEPGGLESTAERFKMKGKYFIHLLDS